MFDFTFFGHFKGFFQVVNFLLCFLLAVCALLPIRHARVNPTQVITRLQVNHQSASKLSSTVGWSCL